MDIYERANKITRTKTCWYCKRGLGEGVRGGGWGIFSSC